ncbi:MAG: hypothetical protein ACE5EL_01340 [Anaerolineae bacterium]
MELVSAFVLFGVMAWALGVARTQSVDQAWSAAARRLGLRFKPGGLRAPRRIRGTYADMSVTVDTASTGNGEKTRKSTRYFVGFPHGLGLGLEVRHEGFMSSVSRLFGAEDIQFGDPAFDNEFEVRGSDPDRVAAFLTPDRRREIMRRLRSQPTGRIADDGVFASTMRVERSDTAIVATVESLVALAVALVGPAGARSGAGVVDEGAPPEAAPKAPVVESAVPASEALQGQAVDEGAAAMAVSDAPALEARVSGAESPGAPQAAQGAAGGASPTAAEVCAALFGPGASSLDASQVFDERFKGRQVSWRGTLRWVDAEAIDFSSGPEPARRAIVEACPETSGLSGGRAVQVLLQLSGAETEDFRHHVGQPVAVEGVLAGCDAFARNLYLQDGRITAVGGT